MLYALRGRLRVAVGRLMVREYRDTAKAVKRRDGPLNGLYGGLAFWACSALLGAGAKIAACKPLEGLQAAECARGV